MADDIPDDARDAALVGADDCRDETSLATSLAHLIRFALYSETVGIVLRSEHAKLPRLVATAGVTPGRCASWWDQMRQDIPDLGVTDEAVSRSARHRDRKNRPLAADSSSRPVRLVLPLRTDESVLGVLLIEFRFGERIMPDVLLRARALAHLVARALDHERLMRERERQAAAADRLRQENERLEAALVHAVHELRSPLTTMKLGMQVAERQLRLAHTGALLDESAPARFERATTSLSLANRSAATAERLLSDLADTTKIRHGMTALQLTRCDLAPLIQETVAGQRMAAPRRIIHLDVPDEAVPVIVDVDRVSQVVGNYVSNALKYSSDGYPVEVRLETTTSAARVSVCDHGPGLAAKDQQHIWERFYRVRGEGGQGAPGLGIGPFICRQFIEDMHGQVGVASAPGEGSSFWFEIPLARV